MPKQSLDLYEHPIHDERRTPADDREHAETQLAKAVIAAAAIAFVLLVAWTTRHYALALITILSVPFVVFALVAPLDERHDHVHSSR